MDFIPVIHNVSKRKIVSKKTSKLSLKAHRQFSQTLSQNCSQKDTSIAKDEVHNSFLSQPASSSSSEFSFKTQICPTKILSQQVFSASSNDKSNENSPAGEPNLHETSDDVNKTQMQGESPTKKNSEVDNQILTIDLISSPEEEPVFENKTPKKKNNVSKPSLEKLKHLKQRNKVLNIIDEKEESEVTQNMQIKENDPVNNDVIKKNVSNVDKTLIKYRPKPKCKTKDQKEGSDNDSSCENEEDGKNPLEGTSKFASKLRVFEKQEPKKFSFKNSPNKIITIPLQKTPKKSGYQEQNTNNTTPTKSSFNTPEKFKSPKIQTSPSKSIHTPEKIEHMKLQSSPGTSFHTPDKIRSPKIQLSPSSKNSVQNLGIHDLETIPTKCVTPTKGMQLSKLPGTSPNIRMPTKFQSNSPQNASINELKTTPLKTSPNKATTNSEMTTPYSSATEKMKSPSAIQPLIVHSDETLLQNMSIDDFKNDPKKAESKVNEVTNQTKLESPKKITEEEIPPAENLESSNDELPCPICNKNCGKKRRAHMKSCAFKNNVSTAQLIEAIRLQEKQAEERKARGLPMIVPPPNQKVFVKKKNAAPRMGKDANMELALALSKSLLEAQEQEELRETRRLLGDKSDFEWEDTVRIGLPETTTSNACSTSGTAGQMTLDFGTSGSMQLNRAGNTAKRGRGKTAANAGPSILLRTTKEEREKRITEKVAMLLVGDEEQKQRTPGLNEETTSNPVKAISSKLCTVQSKTSQLWHLASVSPTKERQSFYVNKLSEFISPTKHEVGSHLKHLSQIPGRLKSPVKESKEAMMDMSLCSFVDASAHQFEPQPSTSKASSNFGHQSSRSPVKTPEKNARPSHVQSSKQDTSGLSRDWSALLNNRTMSDITVYVKGEHELRAHKLVLFVRCPAMLEDLAMEMTPKGKGIREQMLLWGDVSRHAALAMLEFLYCDTTTRATTLPKQDLEELSSLARQYKVKELLQHLLMLTKIRCSLTTISDNKKQVHKRTTFPSPKAKSNSSPAKSLSSSPKISPKISNVVTPNLAIAKTPEKIIESSPKESFSVKSRSSVLTQQSASPDPFEEEEEEDEEEENSNERPDISYLVSMMEKSQNCSFNHEESLKKVNKTPSSSESNELKRKCSASPDVLKSKFKKVCIDSSYCRKSLLSELEKVTSPKSAIDPEEKSQESPACSPLSHQPEEISASQLLDLLEKSPTEHKTLEPNEEPDRLRSDKHEVETGSPIISDVWDNFDDVGFMPVTPNAYHNKTIDKSPTKSATKSPDTIITISSTTTSQMSNVSNMESQESVASSSHTNDKTVINALEDSFGVFEDGELSGLERAALNAYKKVMTPQGTVTPIQKPGPSSNSDVTPMTDYSILESPALQKELEKYGIRQLKRRQAKLILKHIYEELHPIIPPTPISSNAAGSSKFIQSPVSSRPRGAMRAPRAKGRRGGSSVSSRTGARRQNVHDMSFSQPDLPKNDNFEDLLDTGHDRETSMSQPVTIDNDEDDSSGSSDSSDGDLASLSDFEDVGATQTGITQTLENLSDVRKAMSKLIASDSELHHRMLMYEPIWVEELQTLLKQNGLKCKPKPLLDFLDEYCITFRLPPRQRTQKKRSPRKLDTQRGLKSPKKSRATSQRGSRAGRRRRGALPDLE